MAQYNNEWQYFVTDRLGSTRQLVDPIGQLMLTQSFDPFGNVLEQVGTGQSIFGYTGEQVYSTGLVYLRARYYQPKIGRFSSADTIVPNPRRSIGWNRYAYVGNNPLKFVDPSGHCGGLSGGDITIMQATPCIGGAGGNGITVGGGGDIALVVTTVGLLIGAKAIIDDILETFPLEAPDSGFRPSINLNGDIIPCFDGLGADNRVPPFDLPPFTWLDDPLGDAFHGDTFERPDVLGDGIFTASDASVPSWLKSWSNQMQKAPRKRKEQELNTLYNTLAKHEAKYREILESGGHSQEVERMRLQVMLLEQWLRR